MVYKTIRNYLLGTLAASMLTLSLNCNDTITQTSESAPRVETVDLEKLVEDPKARKAIEQIAPNGEYEGVLFHLTSSLSSDQKILSGELDVTFPEDYIQPAKVRYTACGIFLRDGDLVNTCFGTPKYHPLKKPLKSNQLKDSIEFNKIPAKMDFVYYIVHAVAYLHSDNPQEEGMELTSLVKVPKQK